LKIIGVRSAKVIPMYHLSSKEDFKALRFYSRDITSGRILLVKYELGPWLINCYNDYMCLLKPLNIFIIYMLIINSAFAHTVYIVKNGDTLSKIVKDNTAAPPSLYGKNGRLAKVLSLNPSIYNANYITVGQEIILATPIVSIETRLKPAKAKTIEEKVSSINIQDSWGLSLNYGLKYFTLDQSGVLGSVNFAVTVIDALSFSSTYQVDDFSINFDFNSYGLKYEVSGSSDSQKYSSFDLYGSYGNFLAGIGVSNMPIFKNESGNVTLSKLSLLGLKLGYLSLWTIKSKKLTQLKFRTIFDYYFNGSSDNLDIDVSQTSGYSLASSISLSKEIIKNSRYQLNLLWPIFLKYQNIETDLSWGTSDGEITSKGIELVTQLGVEISF